MIQPLTGQPVHDLQSMLRAISISYPQIPAPAIDGIFGERTLEAVMVFQRDFSPPVTGVVDKTTWDAIQSQYLALARPSAPTRSISDDTSFIRPGATIEAIRLVQSILNALSHILDGLTYTTVDGTLSASTQDNIRRLQTGCNLPATGILDDKTWFAMARLYRLFVTRMK